uniref:RecA family profile 1 domain-containing protein n=1 Tax=Ananas comosus var. bracteatus TaxID=296719 RepID=A0A6V7NMM4_ANACO|nr:unnamed protein product [Ananas comosus var. bracteatus]
MAPTAYSSSPHTPLGNPLSLFPPPPPRFRAPLLCPTPFVSGRVSRLRCEFDVKGNGALSGDTDPRLIDRQKALETAMNDINSSFGKGSVTRLGSAGGALVETFPSGCLTLDFALGGGIPKGRIVEIFGPESSGKTTLALHAIAEVQRNVVILCRSLEAMRCLLMQSMLLIQLIQSHWGRHRESDCLST